MDPGAVISKEEFKEIKRAATLQVVIDLCEAHPFWSINLFVGIVFMERNERF